MIKLKDFWIEPQSKKINKKKIFISSLVLVCVIVIITIILLYINNLNFREMVDKNILRKEVKQDKLPIIELSDRENSKIYAFDQYIGVLEKNEFKIYNSTAKEEKKLNLEITNPIFSASGRYLTVSEKKGSKIYYISDKNILWEKKLEGEIVQVDVSKNGYVAVSCLDSARKTNIKVFNEKGDLLFTTFISSARVTDITISNDNKYLAIAEVDTSGIVIESKVEVISIEKAKTKPEESKISTYNFENNELIINIEYQEKDRLICMSKDRIIRLLEDGTQDEISNNKDKKVVFETIELNSDIVIVEERATNLFSADSYLTITNTDNKNQVNYTAKLVSKDIYTKNNVIALNLGNEIEFISTSGWLIKRYMAKQEITDITLGSNIAGIIYRDKIEIINL